MRSSWGFPGGSDGKESTCNVGNLGSTPGFRRFPGEGRIKTRGSAIDAYAIATIYIHIPPTSYHSLLFSEKKNHIVIFLSHRDPA